MAERVRTVEEKTEDRERDEGREREVDQRQHEAERRREAGQPTAHPPELITLPPATGPGADDRPDIELLPAHKRDEMRRTWLEVQSSFIDEPQDAVRRADGLVQDLLRSVGEGFESARRELEADWQRGEEANTESLRIAFRRYRVLFDRLLAF